MTVLILNLKCRKLNNLAGIEWQAGVFIHNQLDKSSKQNEFALMGWIRKDLSGEQNVKTGTDPPSTGQKGRY